MTEEGRDGHAIESRDEGKHLDEKRQKSTQKIVQRNREKTLKKKETQGNKRDKSPHKK